MILTESKFRKLVKEETKKFLKEADAAPTAAAPAPAAAPASQPLTAQSFSADDKEKSKTYVGTKIGEIIKYLNGGVSNGYGGVSAHTAVSTALLNGWNDVRTNGQKAKSFAAIKAALAGKDQFSIIMGVLQAMTGMQSSNTNFPYDAFGLGPTNMKINKPNLDKAIGPYDSFVKNMMSILDARASYPSTSNPPAAGAAPSVNRQ